MRYLLIFMILVLTACAPNPERIAELEAQQAQALAAQQQASAEQAAQEARAEEAKAAQEHSKWLGIKELAEVERDQILADAMKPVYWPIVAVSALFLVALFVIVRMMLSAQMQQVAMITGQEPVRLLPGDVSFGQMRRMALREGKEIVARGDSYYLVDNLGNERKIKALIQGGN